jgi:hypothetical protein
MLDRGSLFGDLSAKRLSKSRAKGRAATFTISRFRANVPSDNPTYLAGRERFYEGMRMAGVPGGDIRSGQTRSLQQA